MSVGSRSRAVLAFVGLVVLGLGGWVTASLRGDDATEGTPASAATADPRAQPVRAVRIERGPIRAWVFAQGTARSVQREYLTFERSGRVVYVKPGPDGRDLRPGDTIARGEVIARLDRRLLQSDIDTAAASLAEAQAQAKASEADVRQADTQYDLAKAKYQRVQGLARQNAATRDDLDESTAELKNAEAAKDAVQFKIAALQAGITAAEAKLEQAKVAIEETELVSPIDGVIAYLNVEEGYYFTQSMVKTTSEAEALQTIPALIIDTSAYEITVDVPAYEAGRVAVGQPVMLVPGGTPATAPFDARTSWPIRGDVFSVNPAVNPGGRSVQIAIRTTAGAELLRDGSYVACWIETETKPDAVTAPLDSFLYEENRPYVFALNADGTAVERRDIVFGIQGLDRREIIKGVSAGERLVTDGRYRLVNGAPVRIVSDDQAGEPK